jgi:endonuclease G, mitochondrial
MSRTWSAVLTGLLLVSSLHLALAEVLQLDYDGFTVWLDCDRREAVRFRYNAQRDGGNVPRQPRFALDPQAPKRCQHTSDAAYTHAGVRYDRGHLVPANHLDASPTAIRQRKVFHMCWTS